MNTEYNPKSAELEAELANFTGSENCYRHPLSNLIYTDGVRHLATRAKAYWLVDVIASYLADSRLKDEEFIDWMLTVNADHSATITAGDGNDNELIRQDIPFTDFPLPKIKLFLCNGILLLPSEY